MWDPLINPEQLGEGDILRLVIESSSFGYETVFQVDRLGEFYVFVKVIEQNGEELPDPKQAIIPYKLDGIDHYGFEIRND